MQLGRLFEIVYLLLERGSATAKELAARFEVTPRTIYRDVETLCQAGVPVVTAQGKGGGISLAEGFVLNKSVLSQEERRGILAGLQTLRATQVPESGELLSRLSALLGGGERNWVEVDFSGWSLNQRTLFTMVKEGILARRVLKFSYCGRDGAMTERQAEPLQLQFKGKSWYLLSWCRTREDFRLFKLNRMRRAELLEERFPARELPPAPQEYVPSPRSIQVVLKLPRSQAYRVYDEFEEQDIVQTAQGDFVVTVRWMEDSWVYGYLLSLCPWVEVLSPGHVRENLKKMLKESLKNFET